MRLHIAFQMEALAAVNVAKSTTLRLMIEAARRGYALFHYDVEKLSYQEGQVVASGHDLVYDASAAMPFTYGEPRTCDLATVDVVMIRQDPPFDMGYLTATYLLERLPPSVHVINNPREVRNHPEKLLPLLLPDFIPPTLVTTQIDEVHAFLDEHRDIIVKPLYAFGGQGVFRFRYGDSNLAPAIELMREHTPLPFIVQAFIPAVSEGDKRIILFDGEIAGAFWRRPAQGAHRANLAAGGALHPATLTPRDHAMCEALAPILKEKGLFFAGIDIIGDYLTEVNTTSPMGFAQLTSLYGTQPAAAFWDKLEQRFA